MNANDKTQSRTSDKSGGSSNDMSRQDGSSGMNAGSDMSNRTTPSTGGTMDTMRDMAGDAKDAAQDAMADGQSRLGGMMRKAADTAADAKDALMSGASSTLATVRDVAVDKADAARETLSDVGDRLASTLQSASAESDGDALKSRVLSSVAQGLTSASDVLRQKSVTDLTADVRTLARRHPGAFMVAAAVAGFAAARFVRSSSHRRMARFDHDGQGPRV